MFTPADKSQFLAHAIKNGNYQLASDEAEIVAWISKEFGVKALNFFRETKDTSQQLVHVILETSDDAKKLQLNRATSNAINERFLKYLKLPEVMVTYRSLKALNSDTVKEIWEEEKGEILKTFESVWTMSMSVVFYYTDQQKKENQLNGTSEKISEALNKAHQKYGSGKDAEYYFDSKESFDRDYSSNWYYYWK